MEPKAQPVEECTPGLEAGITMGLEVGLSDHNMRNILAPVIRSIGQIVVNALEGGMEFGGDCVGDAQSSCACSLDMMLVM